MGNKSASEFMPSSSRRLSVAAFLLVSLCCTSHGKDAIIEDDPAAELRECDEDKDGYCTINELLNRMMKDLRKGTAGEDPSAIEMEIATMKGGLRKKMTERFERADVDGDGKVDVHELKVLM